MFWEALWASTVLVLILNSPFILIILAEIVWEAIEKRKYK